MPEPSDDPQSGFLNRGHHDVFISYAQHDKPVADAICAKLEIRKIRCWIAPRDIPLAKDFPEAIVEAIEGAQVVVLVFSSYANTSPHVTRELTNAVNKARIIIPFRVEDVAPSKSMEYLIGVPHWLDAISPPLDNHIDQLADTVEQFVAKRTETHCRECNTPLSPNAKFCNSCGAAVALAETSITVSAAVSGSPAPSREADPQKSVGMAAPPSSAEERSPPSPDPSIEKPASPSFPLPPEEETSLIQDDSQEKPPEIPAGTPELPVPGRETTGTTTQTDYPRSHVTVIVAGIGLLLVILIALAAIFPTLSNPLVAISTIPGNPAQASGTSSPQELSGNIEPGITVVLTTEPTKDLPKDTGLVIEAEKDVTNAKVTVRFSGGGGMGLVQDNTVVLTRSDGTVTTGKLDFSQRSTEIELQGSRATDRLQVIVTMKSGTTYTIVDRLIPYRYFHET